MKISLNKNKIDIKVKTLSTAGKFAGLMFKSENSGNLLFKFSKPARHPIHSFFVFFPFLAVWLNKKNKVLDFKIVHPWKLSVTPKTPFANLIEIPINRKNQKIIKFFVDKGKV
ncbi:DUF192 domain-containing protein [Candidatus Pacearchaeota archaeon]|nr:DUF192 domain-containing protein [Candidatus Pacearchaeota archaeon]